MKCRAVLSKLWNKEISVYLYLFVIAYIILSFYYDVAGKV
jgi:hypothetical protein